MLNRVTQHIDFSTRNKVRHFSQMYIIVMNTLADVIQAMNNLTFYYTKFDFNGEEIEIYYDPDDNTTKITSDGELISTTTSMEEFKVSYEDYLL